MSEQQSRRQQQEPDQRDQPEFDNSLKAPDEEEEVYYQGSPNIRGEFEGMIGWSLLGLALIVIGIVLWVFLTIPWWINLVLIVVGLLILLIPIFVARSTHYRITNYRVDYERGILSKRIDTLELWHVDDIDFHQSLLDRMLGVGTITIFSDDQTTPNLKVSGVPNPRPLFDQLKQRVIAVKRQRGVIKMDTGQ